MNKENVRKSGIMLAGVIVVVLFLYAFEIQPIVTGDINSHSIELMKFSSYDELADFLDEMYKDYRDDYYNSSPRMVFLESGMAQTADSKNSEGGISVDYSETNIQVEGVDEPDVVKTDGTYLYIVANGKVYIVKAYPAENAIVLSKITLDNTISVSNIFINDDHLIVFGNSYNYPIVDGEYELCYWRGADSAVIKKYDISDRNNPELVKEVEIDGRYHDARMIGDFVYVITTESTWNIYQVQGDNVTINVPEITVDEETKKIPADQIYYVDIPERVDTMTHVLSINLQNNEVVQKSFMIGSSQTLFVSKNNIYLTYTHYEYFDYVSPLIGGWQETNEEMTIIHKISIDSGDITYTAQGEVPGRILNQFSMDERNGYLRIATTIGHVSRYGSESTNNVYVLDKDLNITGKVEGLAPGERIYSVRFMGTRGYVVTFKKVDPLFVIDLEDPNNPSVLGKLKIPGYSDYLHPYDENHIIGIGKDTVEAKSGNFAWYQGIKMAIFDVSDVENPIELHKVIIGDRGTESQALHNHKAFLFDREKKLLVIPVTLCEISEEIKQQSNGYTGNTRGEFTFQGAFVYRLTLDGFEYKGRITHEDETTTNGYYWYGESVISRSLYIEDVLYTISNNMVKMNNLETLNEINTVNLE